MSDEREKLNIDDIGDVSIEDSVTDDINIDDILAAAYYDDIVNIAPAGDDFSPEMVKSLDDALRVVDKSNLSPAPVTTRTGGFVTTASPSAPTSDAPFSAQADNVAANTNAPSGIFDKLRSIKLKELLPKRRPKDNVPGYNEANADIGPPDFKIKFDFESAYKDPPENRPLRRRRERRTGLIGGLMFAIFILCVGLVLASVMWMVVADVLGFDADDEVVEVQVPEDFELDGITDMLYEAGLIRYKSLFNIYAEYSSAEEKISPGEYVLNRNYDYRAIVQGMTARAGVRVETTVVIPEGLTLVQIFNLLENEGVCSAEELWDAATHYDFDFYFLDKETLGNRLRLEGFLFPDTYNFYRDSTAVRTLSRLLREFDNKFTETYVERAEFLGYTVREIVTIASMIEREAGSDEERSRIAAVIYNRLNNSTNFPLLEIDATIHYAIAGTGNMFSTQFDSEYNTYLYPGLPPGPIASPGLASIQAALYPDRTDEYFYALNRSGTHDFFRNAADHQAFVNSDEYGG